MDSKIPKIYVNNIKNINNSNQVFYSYKETNEEVKTNIIDIQNKVNGIFKSNNFIYKKKIQIKTNNEEKDYIIISRSNDYLLTIEGNRLYIKDIIDIK